MHIQFISSYIYSITIHAWAILNKYVLLFFLL